MPLVSVIVPTFNRADFIEETLRSILAQTYGNLEIIVVDDGSEDDTEAVVTGVGDGRIRYHRNQWSGLPAVGRNTGIRMAKGEYVAFLDSDDLWLPEKLEKQTALLAEQAPEGWCYCPTTHFIHDTGERLDRAIAPPDEDFTTRLMISNEVGSPTPLVHRSLIEQAGGLDERWELRFSEDHEFWLRLAALRTPLYVPEYLVRCRLHSSNATGGFDPETTISRRYNTIRAAADANPDIYGPLVARALHHNCLPPLRLLLSQGKRQQAREALRTLQEYQNALWMRRYALLASLPTLAFKALMRIKTTVTG